MLFNLKVAQLSLILIQLLSTHSLTSQAFSWLQNGHVNCVSNGSIAFLFGGGLLAFFLRPIVNGYLCSGVYTAAQFPDS